MRQEAKADVAALRSEVGQLKKAEAAQKQPCSPQAPQAAVPQQQTRPQAPPAAPKLDSRVISSFSPLFDEFRRKRFVLLWRGSSDGFGAEDFHGRSDGHANTLTLILDTVECLRRLHAAAMGVTAQGQVEMRQQPEEFSFHAEKSTQHPGEEICIEGREEAERNLV
jgi:hypothetical protein